MTQNNYGSAYMRKKRWVKVMAAILAIAVGGSVIASILALIIAGI